MANLQITCINKSDRLNPHERITRVGGGAGGLLGHWRKTQQEAIRDIETGTNNFYVSVRGISVWVVVAVSRFGNKYLKTEADGEQPNNLLNLPECLG